MSRSPVEFEAAFDDLDSEERTAFVAALYDARGWESERIGTTVSVQPPDDGDPFRVAPPGVATTDSVATLSPEKLREMLRYAVAPTDGTRLCRRFFGRSADEVKLTGTDTGMSDDAGRDADDLESRPSYAVGDTIGSAGDQGTDNARAGSADTPDETTDDAPTVDGNSGRLPVSPLFVVAVTLVLTGALVAALSATWPVVPATDSSESGLADEKSGAGNVSGNGSVSPPDAETATAGGSPDTNNEPIEDSAPGRQAVLETSYPPGIGVNGVENVSVLAAAHRSTLSNRSYRLSVTSRESVDGQRTGVAWERTVVETATRHRSRVRVVGTFRWPPSGIANASAYANGTKRVVRVGANTDADGNVRFESSSAGRRSPSNQSHRIVGPAPSADPFAARTAFILRRALSGTDTAITGTFERDGTTYFWIDIRNTSAVSGADEGSLLVDERGLVHELRYVRTAISLDSASVRRVITVRITPSNVTLVAPPWYQPPKTNTAQESDTAPSLASAPIKADAGPRAVPEPNLSP